MRETKILVLQQDLEILKLTGSSPEKFFRCRLYCFQIPRSRSLRQHVTPHKLLIIKNWIIV